MIFYGQDKLVSLFKSCTNLFPLRVQLVLKKVDLSLFQGFYLATTNLIIDAFLDLDADRKLVKFPIIQTLNFQHLQNSEAVDTLRIFAVLQ